MNKKRKLCFSMALTEITLLIHRNLIGNEFQFSCAILMNSAYLPLERFWQLYIYLRFMA